MVRVRLDPVQGSEQAGERPALVLSPTIINEHSPVVLIASITSQKTDRVYPFEVLLKAGDGGVKVPSKVLLMQLRSVDKRRLVGFTGNISSESMRSVEEALKVATGLTAF